MKKITKLFLTFILVCFSASLLVAKIPIPVNSNTAETTSETTPASPSINENPVNYSVNLSWHTAEAWKLSVGTVLLILICIRPIDYFANLCNEDDDVKRARLRTLLYAYEKFKKIIEKLELDFLYLISWLGVEFEFSGLHLGT
jgi:hypothetical protein